MKLCKDCKHFVPESRYFGPMCKVVGVSTRNGTPSTYCSTARQAGRECGKDALLFEPALPPPPLVSVGQPSSQKACRSAIGWVVVGSVVTALLFSMFK